MQEYNKVALQLCEGAVLNANPNVHLSSMVKQGWHTRQWSLPEFQTNRLH